MKHFTLLKTIVLACMLMCGMGAWAANPVKITSTDDLVAGDVYYISGASAYSSTATVMGVSTGGNNFPASTFGEAPCELTLGGNATSGWTFSYVDNGTTYYLDPTNTTSANYLKRSETVTNYGKFSISFSDGAAVITSKGKSSRNIIRMNGNIYSCYNSGQSPVYLYKKPAVSEVPLIVSFDAGTNGSCSTSSITESAAGAGVTLPMATPNAGYDFAGWSESATPSSADAGVAGEVYYPSNNITLYAYYTVARPVGEVFYESFDTNTGTGGNDGQWSGSIASNKISSDNENWTFASGSGANHCAKFGAGSALGSATTPAIAASGNFTLTFKAAAWNGNSESTTLKLSATGATLSASSVTLTKGAWNTYNVNITNATEGFTIKFAGNSSSNSRFFLDEVSIVRAAAPTSTDITISAAGYATFFDAEHAYVMPDDCEGYVFTAANGLELAYEAEEVVPAGEPLVIYTIEPGIKTLEFTTSTEETYKDNDMNDLCGAATDMTADEMAAANAEMGKFYALSLNAEGEASSVGFYWVEDNGAAFGITAGKAYLALPADAPAKFFVFNEETGINNVEANVNDNRMFNLAGQRVNANQKGIVIMNGKKFINK